MDATVSSSPARDGPARADIPGSSPAPSPRSTAKTRGGTRSCACCRRPASRSAPGTYNPRGSIAVRLLAREDVTLDATFVRRRVADAYALRESLGIVRDNTAYRLLHGEGDWLPGVIADVYGGFVVIQILTAGRSGCVPRSSRRCRRSSTRKASSSAAPAERGGGFPTAPTSRRVRLRRSASRSARARPLPRRRPRRTEDRLLRRPARQPGARRPPRARPRRAELFAYTGGFAIGPDRAGARRVVSVETSGPALQLARENWL